MNLLAASAIEWVARFPAIWAATGLIAGGLLTALAAFFVFRTYGSQLGNASDKLVELQKKQLDVMESTLAMQKDHYEKESGKLRDKYERDLTVMTEERNSYRKNLHDTNNTLGAKLVQAQIKIAELEARPDLSTLLDYEKASNEKREAFYQKLNDSMQQMTTLLERISRKLEEHDAKIEKRMEAFLAPIIESLKGAK